MVLVLALPASIQADGVSSLGLRTVPIVYTFTVDREHPDLEFWLVSRLMPPTPVDRLPVTPSQPVRVTPSGLSEPYAWAHIYAVPKRLLRDFDGRSPPAHWFYGQGQDGAFQIGTIKSHGVVPFNDTRQQIEITYRIEVEASSGQLVEVSQNAGNPWVKWGGVAACIFVPFGIFGLALFGLWRVYLRRRT
jgi:hypothetical protein